MASGISAAVGAAFLNCLFNNAAFEATYKRSVVYIGLHTAEATTGNECAGASYDRVAVNANGGSSPTWNNAATSSTNKVVTNAAQVDFPDADDEDWGDLTHVGVWDNATPGAGNLLARGVLANQKSPGTGDPVYFEAGELIISIAVADA